MARVRRPWWRVIDWRVVAAVGIPVWYAAAALVVVHVPRPPADAAGPIPPPPAPTAAPDPTPPPGTAPRAANPAEAPTPPPGPFAARLIDGGGAVADDTPNEVWRRTRPGNREWAGPPAVLDGCKTYGTFVPWRSSPAEAMERAAAEAKLVLVVHTSGPAAGDEWFTDTHPRAFLNRVLADRRVGAEVNDRYVAALQKVIPTGPANSPKPNGAVASYFCTPGGRVMHAVPGVADADVFRAEARWAAEQYDAAAAGSGGDEGALRRAVRAAHVERLKRFHGFVVPFDLLPRFDRPALPADRLLAHPGVAGLSSVGRAHALLAVDPLPRLDHFYPVAWDQVLADRPPAGR